MLFNILPSMRPNVEYNKMEGRLLSHIQCVLELFQMLYLPSRELGEQPAMKKVLGAQTQ